MVVSPGVTTTSAAERAKAAAREFMNGDKGSDHYLILAAAYLLRRAANLPPSAVTSRLGLSSPLVSRTQNRIERGETDRELRHLMRRFNLQIGLKSRRKFNQYDLHIIQGKDPTPCTPCCCRLITYRLLGRRA